ncbi:MAG: hypothetical protein JWQ90_4708 [Hydrocarboniphaga sp.]|uniref:DUF4242 domain-containing protein n=1 Tax=Hydrocarboniphaga sp. TaxID=2033016 RepID=UPI002625DC2A|nr:DUF4242 domain-containing protein [Hydrocarboniphaga sp.]MDB5972258.1 hypothetical protein [Hydrocarboniphaga sp.]
MKTLTLSLSLLLLSGAAFADAPEPGATHRYLIERSFPKGALDGLDASKKAKINANNSRYGVHWVTSYANADETKTYCIYDGPNESAIRQAAVANGIPVDSVTEVPVSLQPY